MNEGIKTTALRLARWIDDPQASDADVVAAMRLPADLSVETLVMDEAAAIEPYLDAWSELSGLDTVELNLRNTACKRALYLSAPIMLPDTIGVEDFVATEVNSRIHVYPADEIMDTIRLEAISSYRVGSLRFRYALSIQYATDSVGLGWQIIRPVVIVDAKVFATARQLGLDGADRLHRLLDVMWKLILFGSHDYMHATVLNWFPPPKMLSDEYRAILSERVHPPEVDDWHAGSQAALPAGIAAGRPTPEIAGLELYSLMAHAQVISRCWDDQPQLGVRVRALVRELDAALTDFLAAAESADAGLPAETADFFLILAGWFLVSGLPLGSPRLDEVLDGLPAKRRRAMWERLSTVHGGMFDVVLHVDQDRFPWSGREVRLHKVAAEYEAALRWPAVREYSQFLLRPRQTPNGTGPTWLRTLLAGVPSDSGVSVEAGLAALSQATDPQERTARLFGLADSGELELLRAAAGSRADLPGTDPKETRYARAVLHGLINVITLLRSEPAAAFA